MGNLPEEAVENKARWVRVSVEMLEHHVLQGEPYCERSAWVWLIANAAWKPRRARHHGKMIDIGRGQLLGGREFLAKTWGWGEKKVRLFLDRIERDGMIERGQSKGRNANIITICNYDKYQKPEKSEGRSKGQLRAGSGPVEGQTLTKGTSYTNNTPGERASADEIARQAYLDGERIKQGLVAKSARAIQRCKGELDGSRGVLLDASSGKLTVTNGAAAELANDFPGIDLAAVCDRAAPGVTKLNYPSRGDAMAELRKWARILSEDKRHSMAPAAPKISPARAILNARMAKPEEVLQ